MGPSYQRSCGLVNLKALGTAEVVLELISKFLVTSIQLMSRTAAVVVTMVGAG